MDTQLQFEWTSVLDKTLEICQEDENYSHYSVREKMLAFTYTFLQTINMNEEKYATLLKNQRFLFFKDSVKASYVRIVANRIAGDGHYASIAELDLY